MTPPNEPPSNPYDPNWPKPEQPPQSTGSEPYGHPSSQEWGQQPTQPYGQAPYGQAPHGQAPYGQAPYGQAQPQDQVPYGQAPYGAAAYGGPMAPKHPSATTAMVLGIGALGGMFVCGLPIVLAPFAWMVGGRAVKEIDANPGRFSGRDQAQAGRVMGIIGTILLVLGIVAIVAFVALAFTVSEGNDFSYEYDVDSGYTTTDPAF